MFIQYYDYSFEVTLVDFLIIFLLELLFFSFIIKKTALKDNWLIIFLSNLLKVGTLSLIITWLPNGVFYSFETIVFFTVLLLFSGCIITTLILEKELVMSRERSFNLGFQLSVLSSAAFFAIKVLFIPKDYGSSFTSITSNIAVLEAGNLNQSIFGFASNSGLLILLFGAVGLYFYSRTKKKGEITKNL